MIAKIIQMLGEEKDKIAEDIAAEAKTMADYMQYCDDDQSEKAYAIKTATRKTNDLNALIADNTANINALEEEIGELAAEIAERQDEMAEADKVRETEHQEFLKREAEQVICVEELDKMMIELKHQIASMTTPPPVPVEGEAFVQDADEAAQSVDGNDWSLLQKGTRDVSVNKHTVLTQAMLVGEDMDKMRVLMTKAVESFSKRRERDGVATGFMQQDPLAGLGQAAGGANDGGGPVEEDKATAEENMKAFEGLKKKAEKGLQDERDGEVNAQQAYALNKQALTDQVTLLKDKEADAKKDKLQLSEEKEEATAEVAKIAETQKADEKYLEKLVNECTISGHAWDVRQAEAKAEMAAINKAKEILASRVTVLVQKVQSTKRVNAEEPLDLNAAKIRQTLINHFQSLGHRLKSVSMLNLVSVATAQPFDKVKGLLQDLIAKLEKEGEEAANTHAFCQEEKKKNDEGIKKKTDKIAQLDARLDKAKSKAKGLAEDIETLTAEVADIEKSQAEATKIREEEKATFEKANADFTEAADAVTDAIDALKDYYGDDGASLLQTGQRQPQAGPQLGGAKKDSGSVIIGMLETMGQEFAKTAADLQATEHEAVEAYKKLTQENQVSQTAKETEIIGAKNEIASLEVSIGHFTEDHEMNTKELAAINEYVLSLKPTCYGRVMSFEERQAKRLAEIEGCKEALAILEESSPSLIQIQLRR